MTCLHPLAGPPGMGVAPGDLAAKVTLILLVVIKATQLLYVLAVMPYTAEWTNRTEAAAQVGELCACGLMLLQQYDLGGGAAGMSQVCEVEGRRCGHGESCRVSW